VRNQKECRTTSLTGRATAGAKVACVLCALVFCASCFSPPTGTVSGTVTFNGKPLPQGLITFSPSGTIGGTGGGEIRDGQYRVEGLVPAVYHVSVAAVGELKIVGPNDPQAQRTLTDAEIRALIDPLPPDTTGKEQTFEVRRGWQTLDFTLQSKSRP
jgi:hypothetical protein